MVQRRLWSRRFEPNPDIFNLAGSGGVGAARRGAGRADVPAALRRRHRRAVEPAHREQHRHMVASADLKLQGTYDRPLLFGRAEIERGDIVFEGNRYVVTRGSIDFFNPRADRAVLRHRGRNARAGVPGPDLPHHARLDRHDAAGSLTRSTRIRRCPRSTSLRCCSGRPPTLRNAELRALRPNAAQQSEEALLRAGDRAAADQPDLRAGQPRRRQRFGIDTVQITPTLGTETDPLTPSARADPRQAHLEPRLPHLRARARHHARPRPDHRPRIRPERSARLGVHAERRRTFALDFRVRHRF